MAEPNRMGINARNDAARLLLAAARERFSVAVTDLLLPEQTRLSEWQRLTAANLLTRLVRSVEDTLRASLAAKLEEQDAVHAALSSAHVDIALPILERAGVLNDPELGTLLVRRVEEHRFWKAQTARTAPGEDLLARLIRDADPDVAAEAMELVIARSRRFDRFGEPVIGQVELPAELQHRLVWMIAAALRHYLVQQHQIASPDGVVAEAAEAAIAAYDEGASLEARSLRVARRLHRLRRLDGPLLARALEEGLLPLFIAGTSQLTATDYGAAWEVLSDPRGRGPAILLRAAGISREDAAATFLTLSSHGRLFSGQEGESAVAQLELFDSLDEGAASDMLRLWQVDPAYRAAVARLSTRGRRPAADAA